MFGAQYFGQEEPASVTMQSSASTPTGGGGWSHRGKVVLPSKKRDMLGGLPSLPKLPTMPKPPYFR